MTAPPPAATAESADDGDLEWLVLAGDEQLRWQASPRIETVYPWLALGIVGSVVSLVAVAIEVLSLLGLFWIPVFLAPAVWQYARVTRTVFVVTTHRVATRRSVLGVTVRAVSLDRIQNTRRSQHALGRLIDYGTVSIEHAGGSDLRFWNVDDPDSVQARLDNFRNRDRGSETGRAAVIDSPGSAEQWEAVLAEVRGWRRTLERSESK